MTQEPEQRRTNAEGGKYYEHPTRVDGTGAPRRYVSVTSAMTAVSKQALVPWAAGGSARRAMDNLPTLLRAARTEPCGRTHHKDGRCDECIECAVRWVANWHYAQSHRRKEEGSAYHHVRSWWVKHGEIIPHDPPIKPYVDRFLEFIRDYGLTPDSFLANELTVWNHTYGYAGTLDTIMRIEPVTEASARFCARMGRPDDFVEVVGDDKTREGAGKRLYMDMALQLTAYHRAESATNRLELIEHDMLYTYGGAVLQLRPDGYSFEPVMTADDEFRAFLGFLEGYRWVVERGSASIAVGSFPLPAGWVWPRPPKTPAQPSPVPAAGLTAPAGGADGGAPAQTARKAVKRIAAKKATRAGSATLESITTTGGKSRAGGATLNDDDIPFFIDPRCYKIPA